MVCNRNKKSTQPFLYYQSLPLICHLVRYSSPSTWHCAGLPLHWILQTVYCVAGFTLCMVGCWDQYNTVWKQHWPIWWVVWKNCPLRRFPCKHPRDLVKGHFFHTALKVCHSFSEAQSKKSADLTLPNNAVWGLTLPHSTILAHVP